FEPAALPPAVFRLRETDEHLVHVPVLRAPFAAVLPSTLDPDELGEISVDHPRYRALLLDALRGVAVPVSRASVPAAPPPCPGPPRLGARGIAATPRAPRGALPGTAHPPPQPDPPPNRASRSDTVARSSASRRSRSSMALRA